MRTCTVTPKNSMTIDVLLKQTKEIIKEAWENKDYETVQIYSFKYELIKNNYNSGEMSKD